MTDSRTPIQSQLAQFLVGGAKQNRGYVLLHPDRLTAVVIPADIVGYLGGPMVFVGFASPLFHVSPAHLPSPLLFPIPVIQLLQVLTVALGAPGVTGVIAKMEARLQGRRGAPGAAAVLRPGQAVPQGSAGTA